LPLSETSTRSRAGSYLGRRPTRFTVGLYFWKWRCLSMPSIMYRNCFFFCYNRDLQESGKHAGFQILSIKRTTDISRCPMHRACKSATICLPDHCDRRANKRKVRKIKILSLFQSITTSSDTFTCIFLWDWRTKMSDCATLDTCNRTHSLGLLA